MEPAAGGVGTPAAEVGPGTDGAGVAGPAVDGQVEPAGARRAPAVADELAGLLGAAAGLVDAARAANTRTAYASDWARFAGWCDRRGLAALPATPATLGAYLTAAVTDPAGPACVPATLARWVAAVNFTHRQAGHAAPGAHPHVGELLAGIRREHGRPPARRDALVTADLRAILAGLPRSGWPGVVAGRRDAAVLVLGFAGAFRRAELAGLDTADVRAHPSDGLHVTVRAAKNDPGRAGQVPRPRRRRRRRPGRAGVPQAGQDRPGLVRSAVRPGGDRDRAAPGRRRRLRPDPSGRALAAGRVRHRRHRRARHHAPDRAPHPGHDPTAATTPRWRPTPSPGSGCEHRGRHRHPGAGGVPARRPPAAGRARPGVLPAVCLAALGAGAGPGPARGLHPGAAGRPGPSGAPE